MGLLSMKKSFAKYGIISVLLLLSNNLVAFEDSRIKWRFNTYGAVSATPTVSTNGTVYAGTASNIADSSSLWAITPAGNFKWRRSFLGPIQSAPVLSADEATIYVTSNYGLLNNLKPTIGILAAVNTRNGNDAGGFNRGQLVEIDNVIMSGVKVELLTGRVFVNTLKIQAEPWWWRPSGAVFFSKQCKTYMFMVKTVR